MAGVAGLVSAGVGIYGALNGSDTASKVQLPPQFQLPHMTDASTGAYGGITGLAGQDVPQQTVPLYQQTAMQQYNNPYAQMFLQGAQGGAQMGQQAGTTGFGSGAGTIGTGQTFQGAGMSSIPYAQQIAQTAFDPQNALYAKTQQDLVDQTRAGQAARGVATTPYGAAGESDALRKFNIDWQNQQLGRQVAGGQAASGIVNQGANTSNIGTGIVGQGIGQETQGASTFANASGLPYSAYSQIGQGQFGALNSLQAGTNQAQQIGLNPVQAYLQYLGIGNQSNAVANQGAQVGLNQANMAFNQNQTLGSNLGSSIAGVGKAVNGFSNPSTSFPGASSGWNWLSSAAGG